MQRCGSGSVESKIKEGGAEDPSDNMQEQPFLGDNCRDADSQKSFPVYEDPL